MCVYKPVFKNRMKNPNDAFCPSGSGAKIDRWASVRRRRHLVVVEKRTVFLHVFIFMISKFFIIWRLPTYRDWQSEGKASKNGM